jgi:serine/threonine protein phosphatase PrpC
VNQDSLFVRKINTNIGEIVFAVLCDGMGGLQRGELASAALITSFTDWMYTRLPILVRSPLEDSVLREEWSAIVTEQNKAIRDYSQRHDCHMGSTITAMLLTGSRYYLMNIGDSRAYELAIGIRQLTVDHTVLTQEVQRGNMTQEQADQAPNKNVLTRCVGVTDTVVPDMFFGEPKANTIYLLCSDGFRHVVTDSEMLEQFASIGIIEESALKRREEHLIELNKQRGEPDNISVITIAAY